jgi:hypothetical protein
MRDIYPEEEGISIHHLFTDVPEPDYSEGDEDGSNHQYLRTVLNLNNVPRAHLQQVRRYEYHARWRDIYKHTRQESTVIKDGLAMELISEQLRGCIKAKKLYVYKTMESWQLLYNMAKMTVSIFFTRKPNI